MLLQLWFSYDLRRLINVIFRLKDKYEKGFGFSEIYKIYMVEVLMCSLQNQKLNKTNTN